MLYSYLRRQQFMTAQAALVGLFTLASCDAAPTPPAEPRWLVMKDGSSTTTASISGTDVRMATRCWRRSGNFTCLNVAETKNNGFDFIVTQTSRAEQASYFARNGYSCSYSPGILGFGEEIRSDNKVLVSNSGALTISAEPWPRAYIETFIADNGIKGEGVPFACAPVAAIFARGSLETIATTAIDLRKVDGSGFS